jgi:hypothetical protein
MFHKISITFLLISFVKVSMLYAGNNTIQNNDSTKVISISVWPQVPLIEKDPFGRYLNFDMVLKNTISHAIDISAIELSVIDRKGKLVVRKSLNQNGQVPSIGLIGNTGMRPGESLNIFNPFYDFAPDLLICRLKYEFFFNYADTKEEQVHNQTRLPIDFDGSVIKMITPRVYQAKTFLYLPLKGKLIVWDGHDFYAHHRRFPVGLPKQQARGIIANSNRYAYDFNSIDQQGRMYKNSPFQKTNWFVFGKPVYAPGSGRVIESQNNVPDNSYKGRIVQSPDLAGGMDSLGMGNYVVINHGNGEFSVILHMEKGTVRFRSGDMVKAGQQIGNVGFSGDAIYPHVHYTLMNGPKEQVNEGIPSYFHLYYLYYGSKVMQIKRGRIDSGDVVSSEF